MVLSKNILLCEELELVFWGWEFLYLVTWGAWLLRMRQGAGAAVKDVLGEGVPQAGNPAGGCACRFFSF